MSKVREHDITVRHSQ